MSNAAGAFEQLKSQFGVSSAQDRVSPWERPVKAKPPLTEKQQKQQKAMEDKLKKKKPPGRGFLESNPKLDPRYKGDPPLPGTVKK